MHGQDRYRFLKSGRNHGFTLTVPTETTYIYQLSQALYVSNLSYSMSQVIITPECMRLQISVRLTVKLRNFFATGFLERVLNNYRLF